MSCKIISSLRPSHFHFLSRLAERGGVSANLLCLISDWYFYYYYFINLFFYFR